MTHVRASYAEKPRQELVRLDSFDVVTSPLSLPVNYGRAAALAFFSEVLEETLPDHDPQDALFRLVVAVLGYTRNGGIWMPVTYFALWTTRLLGWLPDLSTCVHCGRLLAAQPAYYHAHSDGLFCQEHRPAGRRFLVRKLKRWPTVFSARRFPRWQKNHGLGSALLISGALASKRWSVI
jgi:DNA repair protein RecO (recombination protein O)